MPANNLAEGFDFSRDQDKLDLLADLASLQSAITTLRGRVEDAETQPTSASVFPSTLTPSSGRYAQTFVNQVATAFSWASSEGASIHGVLSQTVNTPATLTGTGPLLVTYTRAGEQLLRYAMIGYATHSSGVQNVECTATGALPAGIKGWKPNAIEADHRFLFPAAGAGTYYVTVRVRINNNIVKTHTTTIAATGGAIDTGWVTTTFTATELGDYASTPGAILHVQIFAASPGVGQVNPYIGNLRLNWK